MSKYSFLVASKELEYFSVNETLRMKKHGGWLVGESIEREEISRAQNQNTLKLVQLARKVAVSKNIDLDEAFSLLQNGNLADNETISDFADEMFALVSNGYGAEVSNAKIITAFMRSRGEGNIEGVWTNLTDWSMEDTKELTKPLVQDILEFINAEQEEESERSAKKAQKQTALEKSKD